MIYSSKELLKYIRDNKKTIKYSVGDGYVFKTTKSRLSFRVEILRKSSTGTDWYIVQDAVCGKYWSGVGYLRYYYNTSKDITEAEFNSWLMLEELKK